VIDLRSPPRCLARYQRAVYSTARSPNPKRACGKPSRSTPSAPRCASSSRSSSSSWPSTFFAALVAALRFYTYAPAGLVLCRCIRETLKRLRQSRRFDNSRDAEMLALPTVDLLILDDFTLEHMTKEESGREQGRLPTVARAHRPCVDDRHVQSRHRRVARRGSPYSRTSCSRKAPSIVFAIRPTTSSSKTSRTVPGSSRRSTMAIPRRQCLP
jgi:hypothetical protein